MAKCDVFFVHKVDFLPGNFQSCAFRIISLSAFLVFNPLHETIRFESCSCAGPGQLHKMLSEL